MPGLVGVGTEVGACPAAGVVLAWFSPVELCEPGLVGGPVELSVPVDLLVPVLVPVDLLVPVELSVPVELLVPV
ncbi:MAG: hypothetical protein ACYCS7_14765, partial [Acidimicrobiales bacterium]